MAERFNRIAESWTQTHGLGMLETAQVETDSGPIMTEIVLVRAGETLRLTGVFESPETLRKALADLNAWLDPL